jgi:hypothetical protein
MELQTGRAFFSAIQKRAMEISKEQGYHGLAPNSKRDAAMQIFAEHKSPGGDFDAFWREVHKLGTQPSNDPQTVKRRKKRHQKQQQSGKGVSPELVERYIKLIHDGNGSVPLDWLLLRDWTDVSATELRHARKAAIAKGYTHIKDRGDRKLFDLPVLNNPAPPVTNGASPQQPALPLDSDDAVSLLRTIAAKLDDMIEEQRQLRAITADVWKS